MGKRKKRRRSVEPTLFDLPMRSDAGEQASAMDVSEPPAAPAARGPSIFDESQEDDGGDDPRLDQVELTPRRPGEDPAPGSQPILDRPVEGQPSAERPSERASSDRSPGGQPSDDQAFLGDRLLGGLADVAAQLLMLGLAIAASHSLGVAVTVADWMPFTLLALVFSFLYWMVPLAFWGQTPGMAWVGHTARSSNGDLLSFGQAFRRWLGAILTLAFAGLPLLLALTGRSLTDRLSDSRTSADQ